MNHTVDMFAIFSLRRPDILPVGELIFVTSVNTDMKLSQGDLGVQRGLARWVLALHSHFPSDRFSISPQKISQESPAKKSEQVSKQGDDVDSDDDVEEGYLPLMGDTQNSDPSNLAQDKDVDMVVGGLPPVLTPSISKTLKKPVGAEIRPLPKTLTIAELRNRITGKKKVK
jgi:DNA-3-methyladenine glycosylase II